MRILELWRKETKDLPSLKFMALHLEEIEKLEDFYLKVVEE